jgi:serine/threonine protein phosphatase PrpC
VLKQFIFDKNRLKGYPQFPGNQLEVYSVKRNQLATINCMYMNAGLTILELTDNLITELPGPLFDFSQLKRLSLAQNRVSVIPPDIIRCTSLEYLNLSENLIKDLPPLPSSLKDLLLTRCRLTALPPHLMTLRSLERFCASGNRLSTFPMFPSIKFLMLSQNAIDILPTGLNPEIEVLDLSCNRLKSWPNTPFPGLRDLDLSMNQFLDWPAINAPNLASLKVAGNLIRAKIDLSPFAHLTFFDLASTKIRFDHHKTKVREWYTSEYSVHDKHSKFIQYDDHVAYATMRGNRPEMMDSMIVSRNVLPGLSIYGLFDGHRGRHTASYGSFLLLRAVRDQQVEFSTESVTGAIAAIVKRIREKEYDDCATLACVLVQEGALIICTLGIVRVFVFDKAGNRKFKSRDHRPTYRPEYERVHAEHGALEQGLLGDQLPFTRAIGDWHVKGLSAIPDVLEYPIGGEDKWVIIATDGILESLSSRTIGQLAGKAQTARGLAYTLRNLAYASDSADNISVIVLDLAHGKA